MNIITNLILPSATIVRTYAESLLSGINPADFRSKPSADGELLEMNHPAFIYGHLALYPAILLEMVNLPFKDAQAPEHYYDLFKNGSICHHDSEGTRYPDMAEIVGAFRVGYSILFERIATLNENVLLEATPGERIARFPVKGAFLVHLMTSHLGIHLGQMSAWRRAMRLPSV
jgi:hypothetical protein